MFIISHFINYSYGSYLYAQWLEGGFVGVSPHPNTIVEVGQYQITIKYLHSCLFQLNKYFILVLDHFLRTLSSLVFFFFFFGSIILHRYLISSIFLCVLNYQLQLCLVLYRCQSFLFVIPQFAFLIVQSLPHQTIALYHLQNQIILICLTHYKYHKYIKNNLGPNIDPCGIPRVIFVFSS